MRECRKYEQNVLDEPIERRWVQTPDGLYDPEAVPPEWYQWLRKRRREAPSLQEVQQYVFVLPNCQIPRVAKFKAPYFFTTNVCLLMHH